MGGIVTRDSVSVLRHYLVNPHHMIQGLNIFNFLEAQVQAKVVKNALKAQTQVC